MDERHLYSDKASGARDDRPGLKACVEYLKLGDTLVVWKLGFTDAFAHLHTGKPADDPRIVLTAVLWTEGAGSDHLRPLRPSTLTRNRAGP